MRWAGQGSTVSGARRRGAVSPGEGVAHGARGGAGIVAACRGASSGAEAAARSAYQEPLEPPPLERPPPKEERLELEEDDQLERRVLLRWMRAVVRVVVLA